jgi:hypothetical protein
MEEIQLSVEYDKRLIHMRTSMHLRSYLAQFFLDWNVSDSSKEYQDTFLY